jgi:hypothetical protein
MDRTVLNPITVQPCISKSKFLAGCQCKKLLWHVVNAKDQFPEPDAAQQAIFDQGQLVGALAKQMYLDGVEVGSGGNDFDDTLLSTKQALKLRRPLIEAAFVANGGYCRVDVLNPAPDGSWDLIEVKSTTAAKDAHLPDLAFQSWVLTMAGLNIRRCLLMHINGDFVRSGPIDPKKFFTVVDLTSQVSNLAQTIEDSLDGMAKVIRLPQSSEVQIGPHCDDPYTCPLHAQCWAFLPKQNVTTLYRAGKKAFKLLGDGIVAIKDIPAATRLTANQKIQQRAVTTGEPHIDRAAIAAFLSQLKYPLSFMDFETYSTAIPLFDGVHPYQQIPFQFSLHVVRLAGAQPEHYSFLAEGCDDPRPEFMRRLQAVLPNTGSVLVYNAAFEKSRLEECCDLLPDYRSWFRTVERRIIDLLLPFRGFRYYHQNQLGSASMKKVLPALTGRGYEELEIKDGGQASMEFLRVTFGGVPETERLKVRAQLEQYCALDTKGMVWIVESLRNVSGQSQRSEPLLKRED